MQSDLEREMSRQLSVMQHKAVDPWPAFETELHFDFCCEHPKVWHSPAGYSPNGRFNGASCGQCEQPGHEFKRGRAWRFDFAWVAQKFAVEIDGGTRTGGRHVRPLGYEGDLAKFNRATALGWRTLHFTGPQVKSGEALAAIGACLGVENG